MKIIITGHCSGIGKAIYDKMSSEHEVFGFDIKEGNDISEYSTFQKIFNLLPTVDVFFNNAYHPSGQTNLLLTAIKTYKNLQPSKKVIVNTTSILAFTPEEDLMTAAQYVQEYSKEKIDGLQYILSKKYQMKIINDSLYRDPMVKILQLMPDITDTNFLSKDVKDPKLSPEAIADFVCNAIMQESFFVRQIAISNVTQL